jgi:DNA-binding response OmpR family regulator
MKILVVEDDPLIRRSLRELVEAWGYACDDAADGRVGWELLQVCPYDLVLLDLNLPGLDGLSLCRRLRAAGGHQPLVLMLTARDTNLDKVVGLDQGADESMVKPFDPDLLRASRPLTQSLRWGALQLERDGHGARYGTSDLTLTATEHRLLEALLQADGATCSEDQLLSACWNWDDAPGSDSLKSHVKNLRAKLITAGAPPDLVDPAATFTSSPTLQTTRQPKSEIPALGGLEAWMNYASPRVVQPSRSMPVTPVWSGRSSAPAPALGSPPAQPAQRH